MTSLSRTLAGLSLALFATVAAAQSTVRVDAPYARATVPGQPAGGGYLKVTNTGKEADRLLSVSADVSKSVELHSMSMEGDVMHMRQVDGIRIEASRETERSIAVPAGTTIDGLVVDASGATVLEAEIVLCAQATTDFGVVVARSARDGTFELARLPPGTAELHAQHEAPNPRRVRRGAVRTGTSTVRLEGGRVAEGIVIVVK